MSPSGKRNRRALISLTGPARLHAQNVIVPGDPSSAAFPIVAALLIPGSDLLIRNVGLNPLRTGFLTSLQEMGAQLAIEDVRREGGEPSAICGSRIPPLRRWTYLQCVRHP